MNPELSGKGRHFPDRWLAALSVLLITGCGLLAYFNTASVPFLFDDRSGIVNNPSIRDLTQLGEVLSPPNSATGAGGRPLVNFTLALNYAVGGLDPADYHVVNIALHVLSGLLLFAILHRLFASSLLRRTYGRDGMILAAVAASVWTAHPLLTESVTCIVQRSEVLGGFFYLLTVFFFLRGLESSNPWRWQILAVTASLFGTLSKEIIVSVPLVCLTLDRLCYAGSIREALRLRGRQYAGFLACWIALAVVIASHGKRGGTVGFGLGVSSWEYLVTQCRAIGIYLKLSVWPYPLVLDYGDSLVSGLPAVWPQALMIVGLLGLSAYLLWLGSVWALPGVWFFAILAPSSSFVPLATQTIAEHRMYLPLIAIVVPAIVGIHRLTRSRWVFGSAGLLLVALLTTETIKRNRQYQSATAIWADTVAKQPDNRRAHLNLGHAYEAENRWPEASFHYREAIRLRPDFYEAHFNLGNALAHEGDLRGAVQSYQASLRLMPNQSPALNNLGLAYSKLGDRAKAQESFESAVVIDPNHPGAHFNLAQELAAQNQFDRSIILLARSVQLRPESARYRSRLADMLLRVRRGPEAIQLLEESVRLLPEDATLHLGLGRALLAVGKPLEAITPLEASLRLQPGLRGSGEALQLARNLAARNSMAAPIH